MYVSTVLLNMTTDEFLCFSMVLSSKVWLVITWLLNVIDPFVFES